MVTVAYLDVKVQNGVMLKVPMIPLPCGNSWSKKQEKRCSCKVLFSYYWIINPSRPNSGRREKVKFLFSHFFVVPQLIFILI